MPARIILFTRYPEPGRAKTRLIPVLGAGGAAALHRRMTERILETIERHAVTSDVRVEIRLAGGADDLARAWLGPERWIRPQGPGNLGDRMLRAATEAAVEGAPSTVIVGADCPAITEAHLAEAFAALIESEIVLGPAVDGGYYLIGLRQPRSCLFRGIDWGTSSVLSETVRAAEEACLTPTLIDALPDVDRPEDLDALPGDLLAPG
jgi:uncharacterized protein